MQPWRASPRGDGATGGWTRTPTLRRAHRRCWTRSGATWQPIDAALNVTVAPGAATNSIIGANAVLWTANAGCNQDRVVLVSDNRGLRRCWREGVGWLRGHRLTQRRPCPDHLPDELGAHVHLQAEVEGEQERTWNQALCGIRRARVLANAPDRPGHQLRGCNRLARRL
jgi:hypothetical protein